MHILQETGSLIKKVCWDVLEGHKEEAGGPSLAEERKEQLEKLTPPLDITDPPFAIRWSLSSRSNFYAF